MSSLDSCSQHEENGTSDNIHELFPTVVVSMSAELTQRTATISDDEQLQILKAWLGIYSHRQQRCFLEEFPSLLDTKTDILLEDILKAEGHSLSQRIQEHVGWFHT